MRHYQAQAMVAAKQEDVFAYVDDHEQFSSHMRQSSWIMGGGRMVTAVDGGRGQNVGSHIRMTGRAFGISLELDEVITVHDPPQSKAWETVGDVRLVVVGRYRMSIEIEPQDGQSLLQVDIDYDLPGQRAWLGRIFGGMYARWCVRQMVRGVQGHFAT